MFVDIAITDIKVMGEPKAAVFYVSCQPESGEAFELQFCETLAYFRGLPRDDIENRLLARIGGTVKESLESRQELGPGNEWPARKRLVGKGFRIDTDLIP